MSQPPFLPKPARILLLQPDRAAAELLLDRFADDGWAGAIEATHFVDPGEAHDASAAIPFDLILIDFDLPDGDGADVIRDLRARRPQAPILALTGGGEAARAAALAAGAADIIAWGAIDTLEHSIRAHLERARG
ncbi:MAG: response regulator [Hyphomonadaceae bacterium]|nr:response regulator [Hyphomonadaceae bacterium]